MADLAKLGIRVETGSVRWMRRRRPARGRSLTRLFSCMSW
jgi:hypothetical protein